MGGRALLVKDLFLNVLLVLLPIWLYQAFRERATPQSIFRSQTVVGLVSGLSSIFCVLYPFVDSNGVFWDFRNIPLTLAVLYGGYRAGLLATGMEMAFRLFLGESGTLFSLLFTALYICLPFLYRKRFITLPPKRRTLAMVVFSLIAYSVVLVRILLHPEIYEQISFQAETAEQLAYLLLIALLEMLTMALATWLIEHMIATSKLRREIKRSEDLRTVSELAASLSHEIRTPLAMVRGYLMLVSRNADAKQLQYMHTAISELDRAVAILNDYLNFAQLQVDTVVVFDAAEAMQDVMTLISSYALLNGVQVDTRIDTGLWVQGTPDKFKQGVLHLLKNAIHACPPPHGSVSLQAYLEHEQIVIHVIDTGIGMTPEEVERLGDPFSAPDSDGSALSIMVTLSIVESLGGTLTFTSEKGVGTQATIRLPCAS